ncbi:regulator of telomere elongation helicase 1 homolog [Aristolochia californica]|uniref:regulator of telomere elongation helicase 1 homolog n=1 Tax=Aristolochia californica TaxID=171875 RepID=UPI0035DE2A23
MPSYKIRGINVDFPFEAYDCQIVYMEKVIQSLQEKSNALLESPTGTGKTLCLLCATLAWRKSLGGFSTGKRRKSVGMTANISSSQEDKKNLPTIIYSSRTHGQLQQVIRELKRSTYRPKMVVLGSREQMCIHKKVETLQGRAQNSACQSLCKSRKCFHHTLVSDFIKNNPSLGNEPVDIEDLVNMGRNKGPCPYYVSRELHKVVDILFAPYNYLIDRGNRRSLSGIDWSNTILIFDEAHNLESICADAASFDLPTSHLLACIDEAEQCEHLSNAKGIYGNVDNKSFELNNFAMLRAFLVGLDKRIMMVPIESKELGFTRPGAYIYELFADISAKVQKVNIAIDEAMLLLEDAARSTVCRLEGMKNILDIVFREDDKSHAKYYKVHVQEAQASSTDAFRGKKSRILSWWCFNPGIAMEEFGKLGVPSVIVTSGTLSPMVSFALELNLEFPVRLENPHVIPSDQAWVGVVPTGPSGRSLNSSFRNRDSLEYKQELGNAIVNFARIVPNGLLVFFPSYYLMDKCIECWKNMGHASSTNSSTIWDRICKHKQPVIEPKQSALFPYSIEDFKAKLNDSSTSGAIFLAVCRGKVSEGLDFADHAGRAVVVTGIPFANRYDSKIRLKREYLDQRAQQKEFEVLTGDKWYSQQAARAVNQSVGRVIRHRHDYGAIIFCDERFASQSYQDQMSLWIRPHVKCYSKFGDMVFSLTKFFRERASQPELIQRPVTENVSKIEVSRFNDKIFSTDTLKNLTTSMVEDRPKRALSSMLAARRGSSCCDFGDVIPANRCSPALNTQNYGLTTKDLFGHQNRILNAAGKNRDSSFRDRKVIDLTTIPSPNEWPKTEDMQAPCSSKKPKIFEDPDNTVSCRQLHNMELALSPSSSMSSTVIKCNEESIFVQCAAAAVGASEINRAQNGFLSSSMGTTEAKITKSESKHDEKTRASDFLIQVKEKLTTSEYAEFVDFMKALKSKTMRIIPVLESIVRLFSGTDRFHLLRRFKDYVPVKYQPIYGQHIMALDAAFGSRGESDHST